MRDFLHQHSARGETPPMRPHITQGAPKAERENLKPPEFRAAFLGALRAAQNSEPPEFRAAFHAAPKIAQNSEPPEISTGFQEAPRIPRSSTHQDSVQASRVQIGRASKEATPQARMQRHPGERRCGR